MEAAPNRSADSHVAGEVLFTISLPQRLQIAASCVR